MSGSDQPTFPLAFCDRLRMATDGAGVTALVGAFGCPLQCKLCINPQTWHERKDGKPPFEFTSVWGYSPQKEGHMRKAYRMDGVYAADASHNNYDPDYHKRLCALVGDDIFLVADDVLNVTGTDVRLYFHMDDPTVRIEGRTAVSERIRVLLPEGVEAEVAPSDKSPYTDLKTPTSRLILKDTAHKSRPYLTVFTKRSDVTDAHIERTAEGVKISFKVGGKEQTYLWVFSCSLTKIDN